MLNLNIKGYYIDLEKAIVTINNNNYKNILLQIPEGLKFIFNDFADFIEQKTKANKTLKEKFPQTKLVFCGYYPTVFPEQLLNKSKIDYCFMGEYEQTCLEFVQAIKENKEIETIPGIAYRKENQVIRTEKRELIKDLDTLPFPERESLPMEKYNGKGRGIRHSRS